jgi:cobalt-precorrin-5B (C1)-methyltransferase
MMRDVVGELCSQHMLPPDLRITISVPGGEELAKQTWNPRLGIVGGISILGTTGVVHPFSCSAWIHSIHRGIDVARAAGFDRVLGATGSTSEDAAQKIYQLPETALLDIGDSAGGLLKYIRKHPVSNLTIAGGFANLTKLAQGAMDLHSGRSQIDFQWLAEQVESLLETPLNHDLKQRILNANTAAETLELTQDLDIDLPNHIALQAKQCAQSVLREAPVEVEIMVVSRGGEILARV